MNEGMRISNYKYRLHVGSIADASFFEPYNVIYGNNNYLRKICPYCGENIELGFCRVGDNGNFSGAAPHKCEFWLHNAQRKLGTLEEKLEIQGFLFTKSVIREEILGDCDGNDITKRT